MNTVEWIRRGLARTGKTQRGLADALGIDPAGVNRLLKGQRQLYAHELSKIADYLEDDIPEITFSISAAEANERDASEHQDLIQEIDVRGGMGLGGEAMVQIGPSGQWSTDVVYAEWLIPSEYLWSELHARPQHVKIIPVIGDSMSPTLLSDDRVMINTEDRNPSPAGVFALWDGLGVVVKRLEHIPNSDPITLRISSDNPYHSAYERTLDEIRIIGRVIWFARRL